MRSKSLKKLREELDILEMKKEEELEKARIQKKIRELKEPNYIKILKAIPLAIYKFLRYIGDSIVNFFSHLQKNQQMKQQSYHHRERPAVKVKKDLRQNNGGFDEDYMEYIMKL